MSQFTEIKTAVQDSVLTITLNRPDRLNAWTGVMEAEVAEAVRAAGTDDRVRVIVITGEGRGFCAGADMAGLPTFDLKQIDPNNLFDTAAHTNL